MTGSEYAGGFYEARYVNVKDAGGLLCAVEAVPGKSHVLRCDSNGNLKIDLAASSGTVIADTELALEDFDLGAGTDNVPVVGLALQTHLGGAPRRVGTLYSLPCDTELPSANVLNLDARAAPTAPVAAAYMHARDAGADSYSRISGEAEATEDDGDNTPADRGCHISDIPKRNKVAFNGGTSLETTYSASGTTTGSDTPDVRRFREGMVYIKGTVSGSPDWLQLILEFSSDDGTNWTKYVVGIWSNLKHKNTSFPIDKCYPFRTHGADTMRLSVQVSLASGSFTLSHVEATFVN